MTQFIARRHFRHLLVFCMLVAAEGCSGTEQDNCQLEIDGCQAGFYSCPEADNCYASDRQCEASGECD